MLLTKLEVKGFKSFGDKVTFRFDKGITAVVGPNGSGKSNVVDAIRWVLGEQSTRALRSDKMDNIIFNGTKKRKPLQMAEVAMTFKNTKNLLPTEYTEVTIARRLYRSGDGEYVLNGVTCRLKDIQNLLLDTGIGPDSYSIIELKMVDEILNDQNNSRRQLFEEAAGISKFKKRKKETLKKLEETDADLERVEDLLHEISKNLRSLERQAKQAEKYLSTKERYKQIRVSLAKKSVAHYQESLQKVAAHIEQESDRKTQLQAQVSQQEAALEKEKAEVISKEQLLASRQKTLNNHVGKIRQYESEKKIKSERIKFLNDKASALQRQIEEDKKSNERAQFSLESLHRETESLQKMINETAYLLEEYQKEHEAQKSQSAAFKERAAEISNQLKNRQNQVYQLKKTVEINEVQRNALKQELEREQQQLSAQSVDVEEFDGRISFLQMTLEDKQNRFEYLDSHHATLEEQIESGQRTVGKLKEELAKHERNLDARQHEYNLTKSMLDNLEGFPEAIRFLKKNTDWGKKAPLLSDLISTDEKYRVCIENYLEPYLNYYVLESRNTALDAVNLLHDAAKGRGNFFLLDSFKDFYPGPAAQFESAVPALDIVEFDPKYRHLVSFLFENVYIVQREQNELPTSRQYTFVSQNGRVIQRRHTITGGSIGLFEGKKLGRARNLEKLGKELKTLEQKVAELSEAIAVKEGEIGRLKGEFNKAELEQLRTETRRLSEELITLKTKKEQFIHLLQASEDKKGSLAEKIAELETATQGAVPQLKEAEEQLEIMEEQYQGLEEELEFQNKELSEKSARFNQQNILFHQQNNKLESLQKEIDYKEASLGKGAARLEMNLAEMKTTETEIKLNQENATDNDQELIDLYEEKNSIEAGVTEAEKDYYQSRGKVSELEKNIREADRNRQQADELLLQLKEKASEQRLNISSVTDRLSVEFELSLEQLSEEEEDEFADFSLDYLQSEANQIKQKLEKMGPINHMAIEAYNEINERHIFITEQRDDLLSAKQSLAQTIAEIDEVARTNFMEAFQKIRDNFIIVFRSLFTEEDNCDLILVDPADPLQSKIEIIARPKGKRPLTINQLSGGEKTLTATALLFSIYLIKPAPFCIFDEVDAPLDDANIDKFNNIIKRFAERSQFIIVTHNKRTMAATDIIYGVTMVEQGVTTVVPVDLREVEDQFE